MTGRILIAEWFILTRFEEKLKKGSGPQHPETLDFPGAGERS